MRGAPTWCKAAVILVFSFIGAAIAADEPEAVITITGDNWEEVLANNPRLVVEFYAPWCGHCKKLAPEWEKAAQALKQLDEPIALAKADATDSKNSKLSDKYGVKGYPTLKIFRNGDAENPSEYSGPRTADGIVPFLVKQFGPASAELADAEAVGAFFAKLAVLGVFPSKSASESEEYKAFMALADLLRNDVDVAHTFDPSIIDRCADGACEAARVMVFKDFDEGFLAYDGEWEVGAMKEWVNKVTVPKVPEMDTQPHNRRAIQKLVSSGAPLFLAFAEKGSSVWEGFKAEMGAVEEGVYEPKLILADPKDASQAMTVFGLAVADIPAVGIFVGKTQEKYVQKNVEGEGVVKAYLEGYKAGTLERYLKSEPIPTEQEGSVKVVVAKNFKDVVLGGKNVFIEFYAPWCGHCKKLAPIWDKVADLFKDDANVVVAKMDATANDIPHPDFKVTGYPTLYFVEGKSGKVSKYGGERTEDALVAYLHEHATTAEESDHTEL